MLNKKSEVLFVPLINFSSFRSFGLNLIKIKIVPNLGKTLFPKPKLTFGKIENDLWILEYKIKDINNFKFQLMSHLNEGYMNSQEIHKKRYVESEIYEYFRKLKFLFHLYSTNDVCLASL